MRLAYSLAITIYCTSASLGHSAFAEPVRFDTDVRPILSANCFHCHGPDENDRQGGIRLDVADEADLDEIIARITTSDPDLRMPPPGSHKELSTSQIETLTEWIAAGGEYQQHWAFRPVGDGDLPPATDWSHSAIDRFVAAKWQESSLHHSPTADRRTLIRRVSLDLIGLPPTPEEIEEFLSDSSPEAYERMVDRVLSSPHFGEHQARYWLDLVRFADTNGLHHDHYREMTPYRDWVIRALNDNLPYDQFVTYQVAGDLFEEPTSEQLVASGFNRLHLIIDVGTALPEESFFRNVVDRVSSIGTVFLGLTLECAVCHDHKYDPITQRDFYQLYAFFNNFDGEPETGGRGSLDFRRGLQPPYLELPTPEQTVARDELERRRADLTTRIQELKSSAASAEDTDPEDTGAELKQLEETLAANGKKLEALIEQIPAALVMKERQEIRPAHIHIRGAYDAPGELVQRNTPGFLPPIEGPTEELTRMDLATWLVSGDNPLTARVAVNRFWQQLFGVGLVATAEDFGGQGQPPSHPELLDYLAARFIESGWDMKAILREIVVSKTYQQSSRVSQEGLRVDPPNRLLARGARFRLDAEVIRDQVLAISGLLNREMFGRSVKPPQPEGLWKLVAMPSSNPRIFRADSGEKINRRSVYTFWKRGLPPPQMTIFDAPTRESCIARRERTNTPLQALVLMNEERFFAAAIETAFRVQQRDDLTTSEQIAFAYELVTSQRVSGSLESQLATALQEFQEVYRSEPALAEELLSNLDDPDITTIADPQLRAELAGWTMVVHSLLNLDITKTRY